MQPGTLMDMGLCLSEDLELKIIDTDPARRAMVIPPHPAPNGRLNAAELAERVNQPHAGWSRSLSRPEGIRRHLLRLAARGSWFACPFPRCVVR